MKSRFQKLGAELLLSLAIVILIVAAAVQFIAVRAIVFAA